MKYIVTESQNIKISVLRRIPQDWPLITAIVEEGFDLDYPCDFETEEKYMKRICEDSSRTYLYHYYDKENEEGFKILFEYVSDLIRKKMGKKIIMYYQDKKEDC